MIKSHPYVRDPALESNCIYVKRDDLIPYCFGGNKARKAFLFFHDMDAGDYDCVVTYGSSHSNHCRVVTNMAAGRGMMCYIIAPDEVSDPTYNSQMMEMLGAEISYVPVKTVHDVIEKKLDELKASGRKPYFIPGGGHGNIGTKAYVQCYEEIKMYEEEKGVHFDYIFHASGTGTTQAGLICGQLLNGDNRKIIGISIARKNPYGRDVILKSVRDYFTSQKQIVSEKFIEEHTVLLDQYIGDGYAAGNENLERTKKKVLANYGIPLDSTYTGKAWYGMQKYIEGKKIKGKNILFIHTGGTPLFFDYLRTS